MPVSCSRCVPAACSLPPLLSRVQCALVASYVYASAVDRVIAKGQALCVSSRARLVQALTANPRSGTSRQLLREEPGADGGRVYYVDDESEEGD